VTQGLIPSRGKDFSLNHHVQAMSVVHPTSYSVVTRPSYTRGKVAGAWSWCHLDVELKVHAVLCLHTLYAFMAWCLGRGCFTFIYM